MSVNSDEDKQLLELDHRSWEGEGKRGNNGVEDEERRLVEEDESKSNGRAGDVKGRQGGAVQAQTVTQQPQGSTVCWERFLPLRSLKVLLVEYDDCTRHVVTALLRNCSYEVIPVANGVQAWKILEDLTNHVDLVLTEVVMPCVSGVGLLSKIMRHKTRKNVPVIMMSSHDSMGLVFKCLSRGAVDFLVKPIRKNELKNLWQHIWRRCHSSSGSGTGSESGTQTQRSIRSKSVEKSGNNIGSNDEEDNVSTDLNVGDGSDNGSGTQSSWTKKAVEVDSPRHAYSWPHPDSTCAQVVHSNAESLGNKLLPAAATRECQQQKEQNDNFAMGKDLEICLTSTKDLQHGQRNDFSTKLAGTRQNNLLETGSCKRDEKIDKGKLNLNRESPSSMLKYDGATVTGVVTNPTDSQMDNTQFEASNRHYNALDVNNKANSDTHELPSVEPSLKRLRGVKGTETTVQDDRNVWRRSDSSAFSRYNAASNANKGPSGHVGSNSPHDNSGEVTKMEFFCDIRSHSRDNLPNQCSIGGRNINDMGSTTNNDVPKSQVANKSAAAAASTVQLLHPSSAFHPVKDLKSATEHVVVDNANDVETAIRVQSRDTQKQLQIQNLHHDYDQHRVHHHVVYNMQEQQLHNNNDSSLKKLAAAAPHCGSSNGTGPVEGNPGNYSINGSGSGSNHGSNGQNGGSGGHNVGGTNLESDYGVAGKSGSGDGSGNQSGNRVDENKKQREAALTKFREKRKERCFRKKVRYQNRKKLADQRPRIRGQFVRHTVSENMSRTTDI
ncbi:two-component response regulator-like APRR7 isoform X1 [Pyrus x bretschneideri]|uniref:two-component response regulator-like APRR7 isoform X1 n=1 Tax=Pyrus x bretschneideri TaxID=225117 RepID=UPI0005116351|nr:two-component response regulator-like APRR7 isoform X1 [Pyrus x bretschneideri]XP_009342040.1 two-component response regulator-like APRR7 isoform X1 [Pyrus x bretschneideri]